MVQSLNGAFIAEDAIVCPCGLRMSQDVDVTSHFSTQRHKIWVEQWQLLSSSAPRWCCSTVVVFRVPFFHTVPFKAIKRLICTSRTTHHAPC